MNVSIVILSWNGRDFLKNCIPSVLKAAECFNGGYEILVIDNGSTDDSLQLLRSSFPQARVIHLDRNFSFTRAMNTGFKNAVNPVIIGLNNDVVLDPGSISNLAKHFEDEKSLFCASARMLFMNSGELNFGRSWGSFRTGVFTRYIHDCALPSNTLYACAGGFAVDREKFFALGGFDEDIEVYWEDADLCYRAWKKGWKTIYEPNSVIFHAVHGTNIHKYKKSGIGALSGRNYLLFVVKNIHDPKLIFLQAVFTPFLILFSLAFGRAGFARGICQSIARIGFLISKRRKEKALGCVYSDRQVLSLSRR